MKSKLRLVRSAPIAGTSETQNSRASKTEPYGTFQGSSRGFAYALCFLCRIETGTRGFLYLDVL